MSERKDPFYQEFYNTTTNVQPMLQPAPQVSMSSHLNEQSLQAIRAMVREEVQLERKANAWRDVMGMRLQGVTYRGLSITELDEMIDFYRMNHVGK